MSKVSHISMLPKCIYPKNRKDDRNIHGTLFKALCCGNICLIKSLHWETKSKTFVFKDSETNFSINNLNGPKHQLSRTENKWLLFSISDSKQYERNPLIPALTSFITAVDFKVWCHQSGAQTHTINNHMFKDWNGVQRGWRLYLIQFTYNLIGAAGFTKTCYIGFIPGQKKCLRTSFYNLVTPIKSEHVLRF